MKKLYPATFTRRLLASFIDSFIFLGISLVLGMLSVSRTPAPKGLATFIYIAYSVLFIWQKGATPGKMAMGVKVVSKNGKPVSFIQALLRETIGKWISMIPFELGYLWAIWDPEKLTWHDKIMGTKVLTDRQKDSKENVAVLIIMGGLFFLAFLGILGVAVLATVNPRAQIMKAQDVKRTNDMKMVDQALMQYKVVNNKYPQSLNDLVPKYMSAVPNDPVVSQGYRYSVTQDGISYSFCVEMSTKKQTCSTSESSVEEKSL